MDYTIIAQLISSVGFPIVCCVVMFSYMQKESENHKAEVDSLKDALKENTVVLADLKSMIHTMIEYMHDNE